MGNFSLIVILLMFPIIKNAEFCRIFKSKILEIDFIFIFNNSVRKTAWLWPILRICLAFLISISCALVVVVILGHNKNLPDDSSESSISANSLPSTCNHSHLQCSHYTGGFRRPPPPYNLTIYLSLPSPYLTHPSIQTHCFNLYLFVFLFDWNKYGVFFNKKRIIRDCRWCK